MQSSSRAPVLSATRTRVSCWITDGLLSRRSCPMAAQARASQGRRERSYLQGTDATEDAARRGTACPSGCEMCGRRPSLSDLEDLREPPALRLRERTRLDDADDVAGLRLVLLVVGVELLRAADHLLVLRVRLDRVDANDDRLVHRGRDDNAAALLVATALALGLRQPRDRLALRGLLAGGLGVLVALGARKALLLRLGTASRGSN